MQFNNVPNPSSSLRAHLRLALKSLAIKNNSSRLRNTLQAHAC